MSDENDADLVTAFRRYYTWDRTDPIIAVAACPACGAEPGVRCRTVIDGTDTGWTHDARILAPVVADLRTRVIPPASGDTQ